MPEKNGFKTIAENRKARHDYFILESYEAGIELVGTEVKAIRQGGVNLKDSWCSIDDGELLLHKKEINKLFGTIKQEGLTLIPISLYFKGSRVKVQVGLCKGKKLHDKRDAMAAQAAKRDIDRAIKEKNR